MDAASLELLTHLPGKLTLFGTTQLSSEGPAAEPFSARLLVRVPFVGARSGEVMVWSDLSLARLKSAERAFAVGVLSESANILAGVAVSHWADELDARITLAPPLFSETARIVSAPGRDYVLTLLDGECRCRVEVITGAVQ